MTHAIIEVRHLPTSASFYATILQPFGIQYLTAITIPTLNKVLDYGYPANARMSAETILTLSELEGPRPSITTFEAGSRAAVDDFVDRAISASSIHFDINEKVYSDGNMYVASIRDADGNLVEAKYDASTDVKRNPAPGRSFVRPETNPPTKTKPASTTSTTCVEELEPHRRPSIFEGISNQTLFGTILGAAAGAAIAYAMVRSDEDSSSAVARQRRRDIARTSVMNTTRSSNNLEHITPPNDSPVPEDYVHVEEHLSRVSGRIDNIKRRIATVIEDAPTTKTRSVYSIGKDKTPSLIGKTVLPIEMTPLKEKSSNTVVSTRSKPPNDAKTYVLSRTIIRAPTEVASRTIFRAPTGVSTAPAALSHVSASKSRHSSRSEGRRQEELAPLSRHDSLVDDNSSRHKHRSQKHEEGGKRSRHHHRLSHHKHSKDRLHREHETQDETLVEVYPCPLPPPTSHEHDKVALAVAGIEALHIPLPASTITHQEQSSRSRPHDAKDDSRSFFTSLSNPFSDSKALKQRCDEAGSVAPSDSVSCAGSQRERIRRMEKSIAKASKHGSRR